jgi:hypothetical protein
MLKASPYHYGKIPVCQSWLREAAAAFSVPLKYKQGDHGKLGNMKIKDEVAEQVVSRC